MREIDKLFVNNLVHVFQYQRRQVVQKFFYLLQIVRLSSGVYGLFVHITHLLLDFSSDRFYTSSYFPPFWGLTLRFSRAALCVG